MSHGRSRHGLTRCAGCRRHIRAGATPRETVCPFCFQRLVGRAEPSVFTAGRSGMLAASLLALSSAGCGTNGDAPPPEQCLVHCPEPAPVQVYGAAPGPPGEVEPQDGEQQDDAQPDSEQQDSEQQDGEQQDSEQQDSEQQDGELPSVSDTPTRPRRERDPDDDVRWAPPNETNLPVPEYGIPPSMEEGG